MDMIVRLIIEIIAGALGGEQAMNGLPYVSRGWPGMARHRGA
jgi:hypothetical protein